MNILIFVVDSMQLIAFYRFGYTIDRQASTKKKKKHNLALEYYSIEHKNEGNDAKLVNKSKNFPKPTI